MNKEMRNGTSSINKPYRLQDLSCRSVEMLPSCVATFNNNVDNYHYCWKTANKKYFLKKN